MTWPQEFDSQPESPATDDDIAQFVESVFAPLTVDEIEELTQQHVRAVGGGHFEPPFNPAGWRLPERQLPESYLNFLRFSNGGYFAGAKRDFDPLFSTHEVREYMLAYSIPHWMPRTCPIGFDGGGTFYLFDMRNESPINEYPVLFAHAGNLCFDDAVKLADTFAQLLQTRLGE